MQGGNRALQIGNLRSACLLFQEELHFAVKGPAKSQTQSSGKSKKCEIARHDGNRRRRSVGGGNETLILKVKWCRKGKKFAGHGPGAS